MNGTRNLAEQTIGKPMAFDDMSTIDETFVKSPNHDGDTRTIADSRDQTDIDGDTYNADEKTHEIHKPPAVANGDDDESVTLLEATMAGLETPSAVTKAQQQEDEKKHERPPLTEQTSF